MRRTPEHGSPEPNSAAATTEGRTEMRRQKSVRQLLEKDPGSLSPSRTSFHSSVCFHYPRVY